ncbi:Rho GTPase [Apiotrichum porosum]|uniref:Rho GTPase n=1 Tax=Apiotrichum porosum TaxID=105984 RepID=A0A427XM73_9TREE|nr:Rho GTPase [Apiotrichum porosum]RSH79985.1 Rho GTPase [Apiotrichum porosum]
MQASRKLVALGDGGCGKTSLLTVYTKGVTCAKTAMLTTNMDSEPTETLIVDDRMVELSLWDTAGQEDFDMLRSLSYADTHVVLVCFSVDRPVSLDNIETKWIPEVNDNCPGVKILLADVVQTLAQQGLRPVQYGQGLAVARKIKATRYLGQ